MYVLYIHPNNTETVMYAHIVNKFLSTHITQQSLVKYVSATGPISFSLACVEACACPRLSSFFFFDRVQDYLFVMFKV